MRSVTIVIPSLNEGGSAEPLCRAIDSALTDYPHEVIYVEDSADLDNLAQLNDAVRLVGTGSRVLHRGSAATGGLAGAVCEGVAEARGDLVVVMDGDLQHPPELLPRLVDSLQTCDLVVASRYVPGGDAGGLDGPFRKLTSSASTMMAKACFPIRVGAKCSDPMTGYFGFRREAVDLGQLQPRGFKILLEILARTPGLKVGSVPMKFGDRCAGESKANAKVALAYVRQLLSLRFGALARFAGVGALGTVVNLAVMWLLMQWSMPYLTASIVAALISILHNWVWSELVVFRTQQAGSERSLLTRLLLFVSLNSIEAIARIPVLAAMVELAHIPPLLAAALVIAVSFVVRFIIMSRWVYRPKSLEQKPSDLNRSPLPVADPEVAP